MRLHQVGVVTCVALLLACGGGSRPEMLQALPDRPGPNALGALLEAGFPVLACDLAAELIAEGRLAGRLGGRALVDCHRAGLLSLFEGMSLERLDLRGPGVSYALARLHIWRGAYTAAADLLAPLPATPRVEFLRGLIALGTDRFRRAAEAFARVARRAEPGSRLKGLAHLNIARLLRPEGAALAERHYRAAFECEGTRGARLELAWVCAVAERFDCARDALVEGGEDIPEGERAWLELLTATQEPSEARALRRAHDEAWGTRMATLKTIAEARTPAGVTKAWERAARPRLDDGLLRHRLAVLDAGRSERRVLAEWLAYEPLPEWLIARAEALEGRHGLRLGVAVMRAVRGALGEMRERHAEAQVLEVELASDEVAALKADPPPPPPKRYDAGPRPELELEDRIHGIQLRDIATWGCVVDFAPKEEEGAPCLVYALGARDGSRLGVGGRVLQPVGPRDTYVYTQGVAAIEFQLFGEPDGAFDPNWDPEFFGGEVHLAGGLALEVDTWGTFAGGVELGYGTDGVFTVDPRVDVLESTTLSDVIRQSKETLRGLFVLPASLGWLRVRPFLGYYRLAFEQSELTGGGLLRTTEELLSGLELGTDLGAWARPVPWWTTLAAAGLDQYVVGDLAYFKVAARVDERLIFEKILAVVALVEARATLGADVPEIELPTLGGDTGLRGFRPDRFRGSHVGRTSLFLGWPATIPARYHKVTRGADYTSTVSYNLGPSSSYIPEVTYGLGVIVETGAAGDDLAGAFAEHAWSLGLAAMPLTTTAEFPSLVFAFSEEDYFVNFGMNSSF